MSNWLSGNNPPLVSFLEGTEVQVRQKSWVVWSRTNNLGFLHLMVHVSVGGRMEMPEMSLWIIAEGSREGWTLKANACAHKNKWKGRTFRGYRGHHLIGSVGSVAGAHMEWVIRAPSPEACRKEASSERHWCQKMDAFRKSSCKAKAVTTSEIAGAWMLWVLEELDCRKPDPGCWWNSMLGGEDKSKISVVRWSSSIWPWTRS